MKITGTTNIHDLIESNPFLEDFLGGLSPKFKILKNRTARETIGRTATLSSAARMGGFNLDELLAIVADEIARQTGTRPAIGGAEEDEALRQHRISEMRAIIKHLHDGGDKEEAQARFDKTLGNVEASEIAAMEQELIKGGIKVSEIQRLCDIHAGAFRKLLDKNPEIPELPAGHPIETYAEDNKIITDKSNRLGLMARQAAGGVVEDGLFEEALALLQELEPGVDNHYLRKENQLFPLLERHEITGPPQVMWGVHDEIRANIGAATQAAKGKDIKKFADAAAESARSLIEMVYKETRILFPMAMDTLTEDEWYEVRHGEDDLGYFLTQPKAPFAKEGLFVKPTAGSGLLPMLTGELSLEQINLILTHLPVDISFVDENDIVRYYSETPHRLFPRTPAAIGRTVQNCHPNSSLDKVLEVLEAFRSGREDHAEFWIQMKGLFILIRYFAVRDSQGNYKGCLEVSQEISDIRKLEGERRLVNFRPGS